MPRREWDAMDEDAAKQGSAIRQIRNYVGMVRTVKKRPAKMAVATVGNKDRWANYGKSLNK